MTAPIYRLFFVVAFALSCAACSVLITDETCASDSDCTLAERCAEEGFCVTLGQASCATMADCAQGEVCGAVGLCEVLDNPGCERIGSERDDALVLGFIMTFSGPYAESGVDQRKVVKLALGEINAKGGIQGLQGQRELAFLACDDQADKDQTRAAATYLTSMRVPAILGPGFSSLLEVAATEVAIPTGTFIVSPSSTAVSIRDLDDDDLIWRISSSDTKQANTLAYFAVWLALEEQGESETVRVVAVHTNDNYGTGFRDGFESALDAYKLAYGAQLADAGVAIDFSAVSRASEADSTPEEWDAEVEEIVTSLKSTGPDILLLVGYEDVASVLSEVKKDDTLKAVPLLLTDGVASVTLATSYTDASDLPSQVFGVQPGYRTGSAYEHFVALYEDPVPPTWTEYTYDAVYLLAYAAGSMTPEATTGGGFAEAFKRFDSSDGRVVSVGPDHFITACQDMGDGLSLDVRGASGPLDFDTTTGEPESVGILRWTVGFPTIDEPGEIVDCGLAMVHEAGANIPTTYWCNAQCMAPPADNVTCGDGYCDDDAAICAQGVCTSGDDCQPEHAP
ncbi:MAG: ABC transporter substrate-binding protein [Myxococcota bacterium]